jgi:hypothetical protein
MFAVTNSDGIDERAAQHRQGLGLCPHRRYVLRLPWNAGPSPTGAGSLPNQLLAGCPVPWLLIRLGTQFAGWLSIDDSRWPHCDEFAFILRASER